MRLLLSLIIALLITLGIFAFMRDLISGDSEPPQLTDIASIVELWQPLPPPEPTPSDDTPPPEPEISEPQMQEMAVDAPTPSPTMALDASLGDIGDLAITTGTAGEWSVPVTGKLNELLDDGKDNKGFIEVTPYSTRKPNIPEQAWRNKINGWVLVVFNVTPDGHTGNIKVLDANPRGLFEESAVQAVARWRYPVGSLQNYKGNLVLTQKIELFYRDYPYNLPYR